MTTLQFSPMTLSAIAREESPLVSYCIGPFIDVFLLSVGVDGKSTELGTFPTAHHAAVGAMEHWQEFEERINSALPGEAVNIPQKGWATLPKTTVVTVSEIRRETEKVLADACYGAQS